MSADGSDARGFLLSDSPVGLFDSETGEALMLPDVPVDVTLAPDAARMGVIDSGVLPDHPQLEGALIAARDFVGSDPVDRCGHGTIVSIRALLGKRISSVAILSAKVTDADCRVSLPAVLDAIAWLAAEEVFGINMSLAFLGREERYMALRSAIAANDSIMFCAAAGNFGPNIRAFPAAFDLPNVMAVGASVDGAVWTRSGRADVYAECVQPLITADEYRRRAGVRDDRT